MTISSSTVEHFCTLFDKNYLPQGITLHQSLLTHAQPFHLWILCMDEEVEVQLKKLNLPSVTLISLREIETPSLLSIKGERSRGEYCWTLTPFTFQAVFKRDPLIQKVTYLDADLFLFDNPRLLIQELSEQKHVLITDHAYAPEYDKSKESGRFCVQFLTFRSTTEAYNIMTWWQERCLEWCFNRCEDNKFGDQKYLDLWPEIFAQEVQIVQQTDKTLAPWNVYSFEKKLKGKLNPVFYHFHGLKIISSRYIQLYLKYRIGVNGLKLYGTYTDALCKSIDNIQYLDIPIPFVPLPVKKFVFLYCLKWILFRETKFKAIV
jgi:lipopolysaccharide biosynthesis glycosyltransferase